MTPDQFLSLLLVAAIPTLLTVIKELFLAFKYRKPEIAGKWAAAEEDYNQATLARAQSDAVLLENWRNILAAYEEQGSKMTKLQDKVDELQRQLNALQEQLAEEKRLRQEAERIAQEEIEKRKHAEEEMRKRDERISQLEHEVETLKTKLAKLEKSKDTNEQLTIHQDLVSDPQQP
jgi:chromosome segregation ATPase